MGKLLLTYKLPRSNGVGIGKRFISGFFGGDAVCRAAPYTLGLLTVCNLSQFHFSTTCSILRVETPQMCTTMYYTPSSVCLS